MGIRLVFIIIVSFFSVHSFAQTLRLSGKVLNEKNEALQGVSVNVIGAGGTSTSIDGSFELNLQAGKKYAISFSSIGYLTKTVSEVEVVAGQTNELNISLLAASKDLGEVTVRASSTTARKENVASILQFQKNTNTVASVISAESIRRSPDRNTGEVLKRTPGASLQEGKFIIVRGLADRYNQAMLNGILLTSTEPDRKTFSFDLIPSQVIDNIIINKAFVPEYPGEWAGGLIQVNTKDIPAKNFFSIQLGTGYNSQTTGKTFFHDRAGKLEWLGIEDGSRGLPKSYTTKSGFDALSPADKTAIGKQLRNSWMPQAGKAAPNLSLQANGGFNSQVFGKKLGGTFGLLYNKSNRYTAILNRLNEIENGVTSVVSNYDNDRYAQEISLGGLGSIGLQLNPKNKLSFKSLINVNSTNSVNNRVGVDFSRGDQLFGSEFTFKQNTFFTNQLTGDHSINNDLKLKWYGAFTILDGYIPDQRRILYARADQTNEPYRLLISNTLSQQSGSRIFQNLSDYIYTGGADVTRSINWLGKKQTLKAGYMFQVKDRLYDGKFFSAYLKTDNDSLRRLPADIVFRPENFGNGSDDKFGFDAIKNKNFRYMANTVLNAGYVQFDNQLSNGFRLVWGVRLESYDQLVGSKKVTDSRHTRSMVTDVLPGFNLTYKLNNQTNFRLSGSQTVIRPELRELTSLSIYDFELNASVTGYPMLRRTKISNVDLRYEFYPRSGEAITAGVFYKKFKDPIEQIFNSDGGGAFTYRNTEQATAFGAEAELRKKLDFANLLKNFTIQTNLSYIYSRVKSEAFTVDRPLQGQSPYVLNAGLQYDLPSGFNATLLYNIIGRRIYYVGQNATIAGSTPDTYEAPRSLLDLQLSQKVLNKKGEVKISVSDLLNNRQYFYQNADTKTSFQKHQDALRFTRKFGTTFGLTFNYSL